MSLTRKIAHNAGIQIIGKLLSTILGLAAVFIMTRSLGLEKFGWYTTTVGFLQFVGIFSDFSFTLVTANMLSEPRFDKNKLINTLFTWRFFTALIFQAGAPFIFLFLPYPHEIKIAVFITSLSFFAISLNQIFTGYYQAHLKTYISSSGELIGRAAMVAGVFFCAKFGFGFLPVMTAITFGSVCNLIFILYKSPAVRFEIDKDISRAAFVKIWPSALCVIFNAFYLQGDRVILPLFVTQTDVGLYGAAYRVLDIIIQIAALVMGIMQPLIAFAFSRGLKEEFTRRLQMAFDLNALILVPLMAGAVVLAGPIMRFVGGESFARGGEILVWLAPATIGICFGLVFGYVSLAIGRQKNAIWIYLIDAVLSIIGYFIFIPRYGIFGAAGVTIFSELFAGLALMTLTFYYAKFFPKLFNLFKILIAGMIMSFVIIRTPAPHVLYSILIGGLVYTSFVLLFKIISKKTLLEIFTRQSTTIE